MAKGNPPRGAYSLRNAAKNLLKYVDKYGRKFMQDVPETSLDRYEIAIGKIIEGCEELLSVQFKEESDVSFRQSTRR